MFGCYFVFACAFAVLHRYELCADVVVLCFGCFCLAFCLGLGVFASFVSG